MLLQRRSGHVFAMHSRPAPPALPLFDALSTPAQTLCPRKRVPSTPQRFISSADVGVYWVPAFAGMTVVQVERRCFCSVEAAMFLRRIRDRHRRRCRCSTRSPRPPSSCPRKRAPSTPQRFSSSADVGVYWVPAFAGMTVVQVERGGASAASKRPCFYDAFETGTAGVAAVRRALHALHRHARESGHPVRRSASARPQMSVFTGSRLSPG